MTNYLIQARHLSTQLRLKQIAGRMGRQPIVESTRELGFQMGPHAYVYLYNFGVIVFFNMGTADRESILGIVQESIAGGDRSKVGAVSEDFTVEVAEGNDSAPPHEIGFNKVKIRDLTEAKVRFISGVVAESAALDYFEQTVEELLLRSQRISKNLLDTGDPQLSMREMARFVGVCLNTKQEIIADLYVIDSPDETWDDQHLSRLYEDLKNLFEIETRYKVLDYKLKLIQETVDVVLEMLRFAKQTKMEITIIALIAVEVVWLVVKIFFPSVP
jgi:uncharacterized Rmd1/YagE family protein